MDAKRKPLRYGAGRDAGSPTPPGYSIPTHHPTPKSLMNAKLLAEIHISRIREHENLVRKRWREFTKASNSHTVRFNCFPSKERQVKQNTNSFTQAPRSKLLQITPMSRGPSVASSSVSGKRSPSKNTDKAEAAPLAAASAYFIAATASSSSVSGATT